MENKTISKETKTIILSALILVIGVLFCLSTVLGLEALSFIIGISLIVIGTIFVINSALKKHTVLNYTSMLSAVIISFGVLFAELRLALIFFSYIPWLLIFAGAIATVDAILKKIFEDNNYALIIELIIGIVVLTLGILLKFIPGFADFSSIMLGIVMILYAVYLLIMVFAKDRN
jgi:hypothetical protein